MSAPWHPAHLFGHFSSGKLSWMCLLSGNGVCTALPSTALVFAGQYWLSGSLHPLTAQWRTRSLAVELLISTCMTIKLTDQVQEDSLGMYGMQSQMHRQRIFPAKLSIHCTRAQWPAGWSHKKDDLVGF